MPTRAQLEELLRSEPDDVFLQYAVAKACLSEGDVQEGIRRLRQVTDKHPDYVAAYFQAGQALSECGQFDEARTIVERGIDAARRTGERHAEAEMTAFLDVLCGLGDSPED